jgi:hypothetical protein
MKNALAQVARPYEAGTYSPFTYDFRQLMFYAWRRAAVWKGYR